MSRAARGSHKTTDYRTMTTFFRRRAPRRLGAPLLLLGSVACATTGATFNSGVGDAFPEHPPYYGGTARAAVASDASRLGYLPIVFQRGASQSEIFDPRAAPGTPTAALLAEMNAYLDTLVGNGAVAVRIAAPAGSGLTPPDVRFGCLTDTGLPDDDCTVDASSALGRGRQQMKLAVGRPSPEWTLRAGEAMSARGASRALVVTLEIGQMLLRQSALRGDKELELGTGHTARLPWLTSLETPVSVLQLTGALVDREGKAIRIGAEAFHPKRTPFLLSGAGAQALLRDEDVNEARAARREDLPGRPLAWQVALRNLVAQLTGRDLAAM
jgi:hypothetical protein